MVWQDIMGGFSVLAGGSQSESETSSGNDCCCQEERRCGRVPAADKAPCVDAAVSPELDGVFTLQKQTGGGEDGFVVSLLLPPASYGSQVKCFFTVLPSFINAFYGLFTRWWCEMHQIHLEKMTPVLSG